MTTPKYSPVAFSVEVAANGLRIAADFEVRILKIIFYD